MKNIFPKILIFTGAALVLGLVLFGSAYQSPLESGSYTEITVGGVSIQALIADTPLTQARGLSGHAPLKENEGMLFIFEKPEKHSFWMKEMLFSLDMIWIGSDMKVVDITENATPESYPKFFTPKEPAKYVLEVTAGFSRAHGIKIGDTLKFIK